MVKKLTIFAILASMALAAPTTSVERRTSGLGSVETMVSRSISTSSGFNSNVAGALEACVGGVASGSVDAVNRQALLAWLNGAGAAYIDFATCQELKKWCNAGETFIIGAWAQVALDASFAADEAVSAAGSVIDFLNNVLFQSFGQGTCLCSVLSSADQSSLLTWLESSAAAEIDVTISGVLHACAKGGIAASLSASAQATLSAWLKSAECSLSADMKSWVQGWLAVGAKAEVGASIGSSADSSIVLTAESQSSLKGFIGGSVFAGLDIELQAGLRVCEAGGVAGSVGASIQASLLSWVSGPHCPLDAGLKASLGLWLQGTLGAGVQAAESSSAYGYSTVGGKIAGNLDATGHLTADAQATLWTWCSGTAGAALDAVILASLKTCAAGEFAASLEASAAALLSAWLSSSSCSLEAELRGTVMAWMSFGITGIAGTEAGIGAGAGAGYKFDSSAIALIQAAVSASADISATLKGSFGAAIAGETAAAVSLTGRAEMAAFLCADGGASFGGE
ncbi:hypothetical protein DL98DRAFT_294717 [Cadophora sp. DSE1049]|nr:hypothetical protein DL98DRAFT_294717 [Cadophora sp. DSE1049]